MEKCPNPYARYIAVLALKGGVYDAKNIDFNRLKDDNNYINNLTTKWINTLRNSYDKDMRNQLYWEGIEKAKPYNKIYN